MSDYYAWLSELKPGDTVISRSGYYGMDIAKVDRITATQIVVNGNRYRKSSGFEAGEHSYDRKRIEQATPDAVAKVRKDRLVKALSNVQWGDFTLDQLNEAWAITKRPHTAGAQHE